MRHISKLHVAPWGCLGALRDLVVQGDPHVDLVTRQAAHVELPLQVAQSQMGLLVVLGIIDGRVS